MWFILTHLDMMLQMYVYNFRNGCDICVLLSLELDETWNVCVCVCVGGGFVFQCCLVAF